MDLFWDTSAILAMIFSETHSARAKEAWAASDDDFAWNWLKVEGESALARRNAEPVDWEKIRSAWESLQFLDLSPKDLEGVCRANRTWRLRAADAGHLYCFQQAARVLPGIELVCFDEEMCAMARKLGLKLWQPPPTPPSGTLLVRGRPPARYGQRRRRAAV